MLIFRPDFARRIDLPGAGPCPRPVDVGRAEAGFARLVALRVYTFASGTAIDGEAEGDELFVVLMRGQADVVVTREERAEGFALGREGAVRAVYLPPRASYRLSATSDCDIAYVRAEAFGTEFPDARGFAPTGARLDVAGRAMGMELAVATVGAGEQIALSSSGRWPERFVFVQADAPMTAMIGGEPVGGWDVVALGQDEQAAIAVRAGRVDVMIVGACRGGGMSANA